MKTKHFISVLGMVILAITSNAQIVPPVLPASGATGGGILNMLFPAITGANTNQAQGNASINVTDTPSISQNMPKSPDVIKQELEKKRLQMEDELEELRAKKYKTGVDSQNILIKGRNLNLILQKEQILLQKELELTRLENQPASTSATWGHHFFRGTNIKFYTKATDVIADENYVIGVGDKLNVSIWGLSSYNQDAIVDNQGYVAYGNLVKVDVKGKTVNQAREIIRSKFRSFSSSSANFQLTVVGVRKINVNIIGEVFNPGTFNVLASNSVFNILSSVGGPTDIGSVRSIYIKREGVLIDSFDVYEYMLNPKTSREIYLQNNDYIIIPTIKKLVTLTGQVKRANTYEIKHNETLNEVLNFASGFTVDAYTKNIYLKRIFDNQHISFSFNYDSLGKMKESFKVLNGDVFTVDSIADNNKTLVKMLGDVNIPGEYTINKGETVSTLIARANGIVINTSLEWAYIIRTNDDLTKTTIPFLLGEALAKNPLHDIALKYRDSIMIFSKITLLSDQTFSIVGGVREGKAFDLTKGLKLLDYLNLSRGFTETAIKERAILVRTDINGIATQSLINIQKAIDNPNGSDNFEPQARDVLTVFDQKTFIERFTINIMGEVRKPGAKPYVQSTNLKQLLLECGGFTLNAENAILEIVRLIEPDKENIINTPIVPKLFTIGVLKNFDLDANAEKFIIFPGDLIFVRRNPNARPSRFVELSGEVMYPGRYVLIKENERLSDVIKRAGGLRPTAFAHGAIFNRENQDSIFSRVIIKLDKALKRKNSHYNYILTNNDNITIPRITDIVTVKGSVRIAKELVSISTYFKPGRRAKFYIKQFAGGFDDGAVRRKTVITYADGSRKKPLNYILFIKYPKLKPGAIVEVPHKSILKRKPLGEGLDKNLFRFFMISTLAATVKSLLK